MSMSMSSSAQGARKEVCGRTTGPALGELLKLDRGPIAIAFDRFGGPVDVRESLVNACEFNDPPVSSARGGRFEHILETVHVASQVLGKADEDICSPWPNDSTVEIHLTGNRPEGRSNRRKAEAGNRRPVPPIHSQVKTWNRVRHGRRPGAKNAGQFAYVIRCTGINEPLRSDAAAM